MSILKKTFKGTMTLGAGQALGRVLGFVRNVIIARLLSPEDFGIAATFLITITLFEMLSDFGPESLLVQSSDGDKPRFQYTLQLVQVIRGALNAIFIFLLAWPLAHFFGVPEARWAFQWLALYPVINALAHSDRIRFQRDLRYGPFITTTFWSDIAVTIAAWPLAQWLQDYSVLLWLMLGKVTISTLASHMVAERSYGLVWEQVYIKKLLNFGWPLMINAVLLFAILQGDRFILATAYDMATLGIYSVVVTLIGAAAVTIAKINYTLMLPLLSAVQNNRRVFEKRYQVCVQILSLIAGTMAIFFILAGDWFVISVYGQRYQASFGIIGWLAAMYAVRLVRAAPTQASIAKDDTQNVMIANVFRTFSLAGGLIAALLGQSVAWIPFFGFVGELLAFFIAVRRLSIRQDLPEALSFKPVLLSGCAIMAAAVITLLGIAGSSAFLSIILAAAVSGMMVAAAVVVFGLFPLAKSGLSQLMTAKLVLAKTQEVNE